MTGDHQQSFAWVDEAGGTVLVRGNDAMDLLNRLSTQKVDDLDHGGARETLFVNEKGRSIALASVFRTEDGVLLLTSAGTHTQLIDWLQKYTIMEDCHYDDRSELFRHVCLYGGPSVLPELEQTGEGEGTGVMLSEAPCSVLRFTSVTGSTMRILVPTDSVPVVRTYLKSRVPFVGNDAFHLWRCRAAVPWPGKEIGEHANPLESGAGGAVSFTKGCYIGQEVIARLDSYDKVQRHVARLRFDRDASTLEHGTVLTAGGRNAGYVTTVAYDDTSDAWIGLGLLRASVGQEGSTLLCGDNTVTVVE